MSHTGNVFHRLFTGRSWVNVVLFSLFAFCILAVSLTFFILSIGKPYMGIILSKDTQGWIIESVDINGMASETGIKAGDKPIEINSQTAEAFLKTYDKAGTVFGRLIRELTVIDNDGQLKSVMLENASSSKKNLIESATWFIACIVSWITGFYVFYKRPRNLAALLLCLCGLALGLILSGNMAVERMIPTALWFEVAASIISPWLLLHFFLVLPEERTWLRNNPLIYLIYLPAAITLILFPLIGYADGQPLPGFRILRFIEYGVGFVAVTSVAVINYLHSISPKTRQQMKIVLISCIIALVPLLFFNLLPALMPESTTIPPGFSILFIVFIPLGMGYAVVTQKLMDIDVIIRRGVIYALITLTMAVILSAAIFASLKLQGSLGIPEEIILAIVLGGIAALLFGPIKKGIEVMIDRFFYKDRYDYRQTIEILSKSLGSLNDFTEISRVIVGTITHALNLAGTCLLVKTEESFEVGAAQGIFTDKSYQNQLKALISQANQESLFPNPAPSIDPNLTFLVPLTFEDNRIGILCLSHKASLQKFSSNDIFLVQGIASIAAIALRNAMLIRDVSIKNTFVSVASHELRTPLTAVMGYAELLLRHETSDSNKNWLKKILDNGQKITNMANDLLNVSRIQSGKVILKFERLQLSDILSKQIEMIREFTDKHEFVIDIDPNLPDVRIDYDKFGQVISNLLENAVKYSPNGGRITISAHHNPSDNCVVVSVADEGIGISPEDKKTLFTTFHRIQRPETQGIRGSGLGLFIAREWTEAMGGKIWVESELNKGSTFFVTIPT